MQRTAEKNNKMLKLKMTPANESHFFVFKLLYNCWIIPQKVIVIQNIFILKKN
jgi:hypothetical protein